MVLKCRLDYEITVLFVVIGCHYIIEMIQETRLFKAVNSLLVLDIGRREIKDPNCV